VAVQQPVRAGVDQRVAHVAGPAVQHEHEAAVVAVLELPPAVVRDPLGLVLVRRVVELVVVDRDGEPVVAGVVGHALGHRPRPQHAVLLEPQVVVVSWPVVLVQHEHRSQLRRGRRRHTPSLPHRRSQCRRR
jgi:hypothetical protein